MKLNNVTINITGNVDITVDGQQMNLYDMFQPGPQGFQARSTSMPGQPVFHNSTFHIQNMNINIDGSQTSHQGNTAGPYGFPAGRGQQQQPSAPYFCSFGAAPQPASRRRRAHHKKSSNRDAGEQQQQQPQQQQQTQHGREQQAHPEEQPTAATDAAQATNTHQPSAATDAAQAIQTQQPSPATDTAQATQNQQPSPATDAADQQSIRVSRRVCGKRKDPSETQQEPSRRTACRRLDSSAPQDAVTAHRQQQQQTEQCSQSPGYGSS